jgi:hypothetical protein
MTSQVETQETKVVPFISKEEQQLLDLLANIFVSTLIRENETSDCLHTHQ